SILSIQVTDKAGQAGFTISPKMIFEFPTIMELSEIIDTERKIAEDHNIITSAWIPLTPIQRWFFEVHTINPNHWNTSMILQVDQPLDVKLLDNVLSYLYSHHDVLRLRFRKNDGQWIQEYSEENQYLPITSYDFSTLPVSEHKNKIEEIAAEQQQSLDLQNGPLMRIVYFNMGVSPHRILIIIHHIIIDGVSWRILLDDLQSAYLQLLTGSEIMLPEKTTSFQFWINELIKYAKSPAIKQEANYWLNIDASEIKLLPKDNPSGSNTYADMRTITMSLDEVETYQLLHQIPSAYETQINDILLTSLVQTFYEWTGQTSLFLTMEGHGREYLFDNIDLSRTVGWFTTAFPVYLNMGESCAVGDMLLAIKKQLRNIPGHGIGYGILRYLSNDMEIVNKLKAVPNPEINFNYLGQFEQSQNTGLMPINVAAESFGPEHCQSENRIAPLEVIGIVSGGELGIQWRYSGQMYKVGTIVNLAEIYMKNLRNIIKSCKEVVVLGDSLTQ
ncbi:MAG: condensation domain-containing protein, partial [Methanococcaceae archaeon]